MSSAASKSGSKPTLRAVPSPPEGLATDARMGQRSRVAELFEAHNQQLLRFLRCRLGSSQEAEEIAQDAYVRMLQLNKPDGVSYLRAFLLKTAANLAADRLKSAARRRRLDELDFFDESECERSPETRLEAAQDLQAILCMLDELPARCRYAFVKHRFYGNSVAEIASDMNVTVRTVQLYLERSLMHCRARLREASGGRDE